MLSVERALRGRPRICWDSTVDPAGAAPNDENESSDADSDDEDRLLEDEDACKCLVLGFNRPRVAMFLTRRMDRAAPQSMKAKVALFHNFILERGGALKICQERRDGQASGIFKQSHSQMGKLCPRLDTSERGGQRVSCYIQCHHSSSMNPLPSTGLLSHRQFTFSANVVSLFSL